MSIDNKIPFRHYLRKLSIRLGLDYIEKRVDSLLCKDAKLARQVKLHLCHRFSGMKLQEIGSYFGIGESGVTQASRRTGIKASKDSKLRKTIKSLEKKMIV